MKRANLDSEVGSSCSILASLIGISRILQRNQQYLQALRAE